MITREFEVLQVPFSFVDNEAKEKVIPLAKKLNMGCGRQLHVRPHQLFLWVNDLGNNCQCFGEVARKLAPQYTGCLLVDATSVSIEGEKQQLLLTADVESQDIP